MEWLPVCVLAFLVWCVISASIGLFVGLRAGQTKHYRDHP